VKTTIIISALAALALGTAASAQPAGRADANANGSVSRAEFAARLDRRFARLDVNRDGVASAAELSARKQGARGQGGKRAGRMGGRASVAERFARMDANGDGAVTLAEMQALDARRGERAGQRGERRGGMARGGPARDGVPRGVGRMDVNGDGAVSRAEFQARGQTRFARLDLNRDGAITPAERQSVRAARQERRAR